MQAGAEFVHGDAPLTRSLMRNAGLTFVGIGGKTWSMNRGHFRVTTDGPMNDPEFLMYAEQIRKNVNELKNDISLTDFLRNYFAGDEYQNLRDWIVAMATGYDAADPNRISIRSLGEDWLSGGQWKQGRIKEEYGALIEFLISQCEKVGVAIRLNQEVTAIDIQATSARVSCSNESVYDSGKVVVTVPLPILTRMKFTPAIQEKIQAALDIEFGYVIKILLEFQSPCWKNARSNDFSDMTFMLSEEKVPTWWTQYPTSQPLLTGWVSGPSAQEYVHVADEEIIEAGINALANIFYVNEQELREQIVASKVVNWPVDRFAMGAYSYPTPETKQAREKLQESVQGIIFFAGEALYTGQATAMVEGALGSGKEVAERILKEKGPDC